jgi:hypothetical protein
VNLFLNTLSWAEALALLAAVLAFLGTVWSNFIARKALKMSGQQRVAEFRKEWIETLRLAICEYLTYTNRALLSELKRIETVSKLTDREIAMSSDLSKATMIEIVRSRDEAILEQTNKVNFLRLTLNPNDLEQKKILDAVMKHYRFNSEDDSKEYNQLSTEIVEATRSFLKNEWANKVVSQISN